LNAYKQVREFNRKVEDRRVTRTRSLQDFSLLKSLIFAREQYDIELRYNL